MSRDQRHTDYQQGVKLYTPKLKAFLKSRLGSEEDAEDALQEILCNLFRTAGEDLAEITNLPAWLYRAARNLISNLSRREPFLSLSDSEDFINILTEDDVHEKAMFSQLFWHELETALSELPPEQRSIWEMTELEGVPVKEIAKLTGIPQATLLSRKHYAVKHLRRRLRLLYNEILNH